MGLAGVVKPGRWYGAAAVGLPGLHALLLAAVLGGRSLLGGAPPDGLAAALPLIARLWWPLRDLVSLGSEFVPFFFAPLPLWALMGLVGLVAKRPGHVVAASLPWLLFAGVYGSLFLPRPAHVQAALAQVEQPSGTALRVMTFNVLEVNGRPDALAAVIRDASPDVLVVQELNPRQSQALDAALSREYPYRHLRPAWSYNGVGTWSRYPILAEDRWADLQPAPRWQYTRVSVNGHPVHVVNLHLTAPRIVWRRLPFVPGALPAGQRADDRRRQVALLAPRLHELAVSGEPVVVAGDLNMTDQAPEFRQLLGAGYADAYREAGWGFGLTFPAGPVAVFFRRQVPAQPMVAIDHVLVSPGVDVRQIRVWPASGGSDHHPLVADLVVPARKG